MCRLVEFSWVYFHNFQEQFLEVHKLIWQVGIHGPPGPDRRRPMTLACYRWDFATGTQLWVYSPERRSLLPELVSKADGGQWKQKQHLGQGPQVHLWTLSTSELFVPKTPIDCWRQVSTLVELCSVPGKVCVIGVCGIVPGEKTHSFHVLYIQFVTISECSLTVRSCMHSPM